MNTAHCTVCLAQQGRSGITAHQMPTPHSSIVVVVPLKRESQEQMLHVLQELKEHNINSAKQCFYEHNTTYGYTTPSPWRQLQCLQSQNEVNEF
jgi:hypothetical protein